MNSGIWMFWLVRAVRVNWVKQDKLAKKFDQKIRQKIEQKNWAKKRAKNWAKKQSKSWAKKLDKKLGEKLGKIIKCDHTNSGRQFVVIEFTDLVEFMNVIE